MNLKRYKMSLKKIVFPTALLFTKREASSQNVNQKRRPKQIHAKTIVFIHGLFMNNKTWEGWKSYFEDQGYACYAPAHPKHEGNPSELRTNPPEGLEDVEFEDWITNLENLIDSLAEKPILIGHSFGGLTAQKLVESGKAAAAILISSAPPKGNVAFNLSFFKANNPVISPLKGNSLFNPAAEKYKKWFHFAIANTFSKAESDILFEQYAVPESRRTPRASLRKIAAIDTQKPHVPLLFIGGVEDVIVPNVLIRKTIKAYSDENSIVDFKFYENKDHFICGAPGWEAIAQDCLNWLSN